MCALVFKNVSQCDPIPILEYMVTGGEAMVLCYHVLSKRLRGRCLKDDSKLQAAVIEHFEEQIFDYFTHRYIEVSNNKNRSACFLF